MLIIKGVRKMNDTHTMKKNRKLLLFSSTCLLLAVAVFLIGHSSQLLKHLTYGDESYTITLNESNSPSNLSTEEFGPGNGQGRYVSFNYTSAKLALSQHVVINVGGTLSNSAVTRITSIKSITATFSGGEATVYHGPTKTAMGSSQTLTSSTPYYFSTDPYFFSLTNTGVDALSLTSLVINYSCVDTHSTVEFVTSGGSLVAPLTQAPGSSLEAPGNPTKDGYLFEGWFTEASLINEYTFVTMPEDDLILYAKWGIDPAWPVLTISEFKALEAPENAEHHFVRGVVMLEKSDMEIIVIADASGTLILFGYQEVLVGDEIRAGGYYAAESTLVTMAGVSGSAISVDLYSHGNDIALAPTALSVSQYNALATDNPNNWVVYAEINGTINVDQNSHQVTLTSGEDTMPVIVIGVTDFISLRDYSGFRVNFRGVILPNMDNPLNILLMFVYNGSPDYIDLDYVGESGDAELFALLETMFRGAFESPTYFPGQLVDLPAEHPVVPVTITYATFGTNASKYDTVTKRLSNDISEVTYIDVQVNAVLHESENASFNIQLHVDPSIIISIAALKVLPDSNTVSRVIHCVILNAQAAGENIMLLVADETSIIYINTNNGSLAPGDEVIAVGYKVTQDNVVYLYNDPQRTVDHVVATGQAMPMTPTAITFADFAALTVEYVGSDFRYYELYGTLSYMNPADPANSIFVLTSGEINIYIYPTSPASRSTLSTYVGQAVTVRGIAMLGGEPGSQVVLLGFLPISGCISA